MQIEFILYYISTLKINMIQESFDNSIKRECFDSDSARRFFAKNEQQLQGLSPKQQKLIRNKVAAKNCRLKKKNYLMELQQNQKKIMHQIKSVEQQLQKTKQKLNAYMTKHKSNDSFNHDEKPTYERLKFLVRQEGELDEDEANMLIQLLINRIGVTGRQRKRMVQYYSNRLINFSIPAVYRYLLITSVNKSGFFKADDINKQQQEWHQSLISSLNLTEEEKYKMQGKTPDMQRLNKKWSQKISQFKQIRQKIYRLSSQVQEQLLPLRYQLTVQQCGQMFIALQNRKYNKQTLYGSENDTQSPDIQRLTKKIKIN